MAHAKPEDLKDLKILLNEIREIAALKEKSVGCFYFKSKSVLHFHTKADRLYAHVFNGKDWLEVDIERSASDAKQRKLFKSILQILPVDV